MVVDLRDRLTAGAARAGLDRGGDGVEEEGEDHGLPPGWMMRYECKGIAKC